MAPMHAYGHGKLPNCGAAASLRGRKRYEGRPPSPHALAKSPVLPFPKHTLNPSPNPVQREALQAEV